MSRIVLVALWFLHCCFVVNVNASEIFTIKGRILAENNNPIARVHVKVGEQQVLSDKTGRFNIEVQVNDLYQINLTKKNYFNSVQTFSHFELNTNNQDYGEITDITLVAKKDSRVMLAFGGDSMMGRRFYKPYFGDEVLLNLESKLPDSKAIVKYIKPYMSIADYAAVNLETQIASSLPGERAPKSVTFYSQPEILDALSWAGIDYVSLGNNHTYDYMDSGLKSTIAFLENSTLDFSGAGFSEKDALKAHQETINNTDFSMLAYVGWEGSKEPSQTANHQHGGAAFGSMDNIAHSVKQEVNQNRTTIVQYHGSQEYANNPTGVTEQRLKTALDNGAALAIAHHPHVTQGLELYDGKLIAYSMGNFIFDQNFSATQHSFILYVWLDQGKFHRAEIVPLYVKGYKPTPATGMNRYTVMKRLTELSKTRNTYISQSGGHGIITVENKAPRNKTEQVALSINKDEKIISLYNTPWQAQLRQILLPETQLKYRLGTNLINGSDFESFDYFDGPERGWLYDRQLTSLNLYGASGHKSLALSLQNEQTATFGMQSFKRVYTPSSQMTIKAKFKTTNTVKVNYYWQGRKKRQKLFDAFKNSKKHLINSVEITGNGEWQNMEVDFNSPRIGYKSYRVLVEFELLNGNKGQVDIDDFALIEWQSAFSSNPKINFFSIKSRQPAYIGLNNHTNKTIVLKY
ncbi:CapA family protein [Colwellia sp. MB02u-9]|uniref:CapA family protein n=1 Tax=Colwellia sp. MB02u-9 TaxID=2759823 RepID=UPI0015F678D2|nr:CapA family protein [Colwellia sp. MB02u-9]MBA6296601.1 CapA family protein [Colwellia sp. MB02u-9]